MQNKIKVCHVATVAGSLSVLLINQLRFLRDKCGYEVHGAAANDIWTARLRREGFPIHPISLKRKVSPLADLRALVQFFLLFRKEKFDIVHVHTPKAAFLGSLAAWMARIPIRINTIHGFYFHENSSKLKYYFFWFLEIIISHCVHYSLSQNSEDKIFAIENNLYKPDRISLLGNGVDIDRFNSYPDLRSSVLSELDIPDNSYILGIVGRLTNEKGHREFLQALKILANKNLPIVGIVLGISERTSLKFYHKYADELSLGNKVQFIGWREDIERFYNSFDIFVLPSYREGFPRSAMEACACGIPCVLTNIRGCREVVKNGFNGFLVPEKNVVSLVKKIECLLNNQDLRKKMGAEARRQAEDNFDEREVFKKVGKVYEKLLMEKYN